MTARYLQGLFGCGAAEFRDDLRDSIADQLVTIAWAALLIYLPFAQERGEVPPGPWPVVFMGAVAVGFALWRLFRLVGL
ncbi:MAG: hypothetical protein HYV15_05095, partial [Elusimicrobia bacterium]|nr:hypothetical protein [Elusimicrobiota bacterium]